MQQHPRWYNQILSLFHSYACPTAVRMRNTSNASIKIFWPLSAVGFLLILSFPTQTPYNYQKQSSEAPSFIITCCCSFFFPQFPNSPTYRHCVIKWSGGSGHLVQEGSFFPWEASLKGHQHELPSALVGWQASRGTSPGTFLGHPFIFFLPFLVCVTLFLFPHFQPIFLSSSYPCLATHFWCWHFCLRSQF